MGNNMLKKILLGLSLLVLAGCATSTSYVNYTAEHFPSKGQFYPINIYPQSQPFSAANPYYVIGKVSIEGFFSNGVTSETLNNEARTIARRKGANAIISATTPVIHYGGDTLLRFQGDLIVYAPRPPSH
jgi:hypothetical protein